MARPDHLHFLANLSLVPTLLAIYTHELRIAKVSIFNINLMESNKVKSI